MRKVSVTTVAIVLLTLVATVPSRGDDGFSAVPYIQEFLEGELHQMERQIEREQLKRQLMCERTKTRCYEKELAKEEPNLDKCNQLFWQCSQQNAGGYYYGY